MNDYFVIEGNLGLTRGFRMYLFNQKRRFERMKRITVLDLGPAVGALTSLFIMQELARVDLLHKVKLIMLDVSERVISKNQERNFEFPHALISSLLKSRFYEKLRTSKGIVGSAHEIPLKDGSVDICLAGFLFSNLHEKIKKQTASEIERVTKSGGFIGLADQWFTNPEAYQDLHQDDEVPLAYESMIPFRRLRKSFKQTETFEAHENDNHYYLCGIKKAA